ncbi:MAG TPA: hypothetical protein VEC35_01190 [Noviherbaspirillum sp.]|nr:hypothetical protein [Noviherbaspirillum sp.]
MNASVQEKRVVSLVDDNLTNPAYTPENLLDVLAARLKVPNDAQLSKALRIDPAMVSKLRSKKAELSAALMVRMHDVSGMTIREIRELAGIVSTVASFQPTASKTRTHRCA